MKRTVCLLFLLLSLTLTGCLHFVAPGTAPPTPTIDLYADPVIVIDETRIERQNRYDAHGNHVGYYQYTYGTNCGNDGVVLLSFLDLDGNVLNAYSPKLAGGTLYGGQFGSMNHDYFELTDIAEGNHQDPITSNEYKFVPYSGGMLYSYIENRNGATTRCDLYGVDGQVVASLLPADANNQLSIPHIRIYVDDYFTDHFCVSEEYSEDGTRYTKHTMYYSMEGQLLADFWPTNVAVPDSHMQKPVRIECKDEAGEVRSVFAQSVEGSYLNAYFDEQRDLLYIAEYWDQTVVMTAYCVPGTYEVLFKAQKIYENGVFSHTEMEAFGGEVKVTDGQTPDTYTKVEIYDSNGVLQKTITAPESGGWLTAYWESEWLWIDIYDADGNEVDYYAYAPTE